MKRLIPADTVDAEGTVWPTIGENIRNGAKSFSERDARAIVDILFPIGSIFCGDNVFILSIGEWKQFTIPAGSVIRLGVNAMSGTISSLSKITESSSEKGQYISVRLWKRVS